MLAYLSDYDWHKGFYSVVGRDTNSSEQREKADIYKTLLEGAMRVILPSVWDICLKETGSGVTSKISRSAFPNTLCTHSVKCKLEIEYYPLADSSAIRDGITSAVRYTENKLRALFGVKSRIMVKSVPDSYRELIDCYFAELIRKTEKTVKQRNIPEYEKLYEAPREKLSFEGADEIERQSWDTTFRLCDTEDYIEYASLADTQTSISGGAADSAIISNEVDSLAVADLTANDLDDDVVTADAYGLSLEEIGYIAALCNGDYSYSGTIPEESIVERINEAFSDGYGDIIIESTDSGYEIITDYKEEVIEWLRKF